MVTKNQKAAFQRGDMQGPNQQESWRLNFLKKNKCFEISQGIWIIKKPI